MKLKTKDGKYFSEIGSWTSLVTAIFAVIVLKMVQSNIFSFWAGTLIFAIAIGIFVYFSDKGKNKEVFQKAFQFLINNWFSSTFVILAIFAIYWFGVRPVMVRKSCSVINWVTPASPEIPASVSWGNPKCEPKFFNTTNQKQGNAFDRTITPSIPEDCLPWHPAVPAEPERKGERMASDNEYKTCLRKSGI